MKNKILLFFILSSLVFSADVSITNFKAFYGSGSGWTFQGYSYTLNVIRLPNEIVNKQLSSLNSFFGLKKTTSGYYKFSNYGYFTVSMPSGITLNPYYLAQKSLDSHASYSNGARSGNQSIIQNMAYNGAGNYSTFWDKRTLYISNTVSDGTYNFSMKCQGDVNGNKVLSKTYGSKIIIKTLPSISVQNINFGELYFGDKVGQNYSKKSTITISNGSSNNSVRLSVTSSTNLTRVGSSDKIPITCSLKTSTLTLNSSGNGSTYFTATVNTNKKVSYGVYSGDVTVSVNYN